MKKSLLFFLLLLSLTFSTKAQMPVNFNDPNLPVYISNIVAAILATYNSTNGLFQPANANLTNFSNLSTNAFDASGSALAATNHLGQAAFVAGSTFQATNNNLTLFGKLTTNAYAATVLNPFTGIVTNWYNFPASSNRTYYSVGNITNVTKP